MAKFAQLLGPLVQQSGADLIRDMEFFCTPALAQPGPPAQQAAEEGAAAKTGYHSDDEPPGCAQHLITCW